MELSAVETVFVASQGGLFVRHVSGIDELGYLTVLLDVLLSVSRNRLIFPLSGHRMRRRIENRDKPAFSFLLVNKLDNLK